MLASLHETEGSAKNCSEEPSVQKQKYWIPMANLTGERQHLSKHWQGSWAFRFDAAAAAAAVDDSPLVD